jgi:acetyl-CoA/propionyl-CoA carboxylase biotin carboxyl carrier protein
MNTRIQVEHPITEAITGVDIVREMILAAAGEPLATPPSFQEPSGHAIEVRVNAEDPLRGFRPTPSTITRYREPGGIGIRVDSGVYQGYTIPDVYDSLIAKLIAWAPDREAARLRALRALGEYEIGGPASTLGFAATVLQHPAFVQGKVSTTFVAEHAAELIRDIEQPRTISEPGGMQSHRGEERSFEVEVNRKLFRIRVTELQQGRSPGAGPARKTRTSASGGSNALLSPMHGTVVEVRKQPGDPVHEGETLFVIEAMKMENEVGSPRSGTVRAVEAGIGDTVEIEQRLAVID